MTRDFSIPGREKYLAEQFYDLFDLQFTYDFSFARRTLLERVIWKFMPQGYYCHLDGYDEDRFQKFSDGFFFCGRIIHLHHPDMPANQLVALAFEFDRFKLTVKHASIWKGIEACYLNDLPEDEYDSLDDVFEPDFEIGSDWKLAFTRDKMGWRIEPGFDIFPFLSRDTASSKGL